jgi:hypothetical protein
MVAAAKSMALTTFDLLADPARVKAPRRNSRARDLPRLLSEIPREEIDRFIATQEMGRLVTVSEDGTPHVGLYNFVYAPPAIELHLVRGDEQVADLKARRAAPSRWTRCSRSSLPLGPSGVRGLGTAYHRTVIFECAATVAEDPAVVMAQQQRLLAKHQPEGQYRPLKVDDAAVPGRPEPAGRVTLRITACRAKFKLGQNRPVAARKRVIEELRGGTGPTTPAPPTRSSGRSITPSRQEPPMAVTRSIRPRPRSRTRWTVSPTTSRRSRIRSTPSRALLSRRAGGGLAERFLERQGARVERGVGGLPTAFRATIEGSGPGPTIAIMAEYDALPNIGTRADTMSSPPPGRGRAPPSRPPSARFPSRVASRSSARRRKKAARAR